ncbi:hypothetical protein CDAR_176641 [Caerostris darwini]|uniref:Uncharacterized protein n=1 Tax=Caerostris darwini TaxID=1538125 RepID=A0AAV4VL51_9ARAC|nr:hypothetical protein CDAR_176641 [Caerostris darwini]
MAVLSLPICPSYAGVEGRFYNRISEPATMSLSVCAFDVTHNPVTEDWNYYRPGANPVVLERKKKAIFFVVAIEGPHLFGKVRLFLSGMFVHIMRDLSLYSPSF